MAHPQETRDKVRNAYISGNQSLETAAMLAGVTFGTARRWRDAARRAGDDWDKLRAAYTLAGGSIEELARAMMAGFLQQYQYTMEQLREEADITAADKVKLLASLADAFNKTVGASAKILPETSALAVALKVTQKMAEFVQKNYPQHLAAFLEVLEPFAAEVEREFGA